MQYDPFQLKAIAAIDQERSVLVSAPTGAGKTAIAEYAIEKAFERGERVVYTAPIKALSNQKYRDFSETHPGRVGLLTGDVSVNPDAPLVIMTTEIYRNRLFEAPERLESTTWIIFDEVHYLDDPERGTVWEEAMMFSPPHVRFLALSATAPNIQELADWIANILGHPMEVVIETKRPVPLAHLFQCQGVIYDDLHRLKKEGYLGRDSWPSGFGRDRFQRRGQRGHHQGWEKSLRAKPNRSDELIRHIEQQKRLPLLYFAFGRKRVEELAWEMQRHAFFDPGEKQAAETMYDDLCRRAELTHEKSAAEMRRLISNGVAFHHAGMLPSLKEVVERVFTAKLIKVIFTTETFALGINMPAKTVVFDEMRKFYGTHFANLRTRDYYQMAGRAGRRGKDDKGYVYARVNPHQIQHSAVERIVYGKPEAIESQFNSCYATLLNLYSHFGRKLLDAYPRSFHHFQSNRKGREKGVESIERKLALLTEMGYMQGDRLTPKGTFASWMYGYELILSELMAEGYLESLDQVRLSALLCALVFEPRKNQFAPRLPQTLQSVEKKAVSAARRIGAKELAHKIYPQTRLPHFHLALALEAWMGGVPFADLARHTDVDEGEIIRHFRMVIQLLRQIRQAPEGSDRLRQAAGAAIARINRDWVDAEKQLEMVK